jgi:lipopolysaccharide transport system ATP-binding protein
MAPAVVFDGVWKKFRRGERHDSLRDLLPSVARRMFGRPPTEIGNQEFWALQNVSFEVRPGEALGIIGPNGAGKSTSLKLLTRILKPTRGSCRVSGRVGALIEVAAGFHPDLTGRENIYLQGSIMGMKRADIARKLDPIIDFAGIEPFIDMPVKRYSSGMNARLGFAIAAHLDPDVLIIDEVLAVGDMAFQEKCRKRMTEFRRDGVAIVFVSHNLQAVAQLCTHGLLFEKGSVRAEGSAADVITAYCETPANASEGGTIVADVSVESSGHLPRGGMQSVAPGAVVRLDVRVDASMAIAAGVIGVNVWDAARSTYVYVSSTDLGGYAPVSMAAGDRLTTTIYLTLHLCRGVYHIQLNLYDLQRQESVIGPHTVQAVHVEESTAQAGVANLYMSATPLQVSAVELRPVPA